MSKISSKYLSRFSKIRDLDGYKLYGNRMLVERIIPEDHIKTKSGLYIASNSADLQVNTVGSDKPEFFIVIDIGEGYTLEDHSLEPLEVNLGDIIMLPKLCVKYFSFFGEMEDYKPDTIGIARESDIEMRFSSVEAYEEFFKRLNQGETV